MTTNGILKRLCGNIAAGRFDWRKYCPYTNMPEVEYDWEMGKLTIGGEKWKNYLHNQ